MGKKGKKITAGVLSVAAVLCGLSLLTRLVMPKYDGVYSPLEGNFTQEYYQETVPHDVLFVGDCEVYENFDPTYLWEHYGITSYIRGNAQQQVWQSACMLEDALRVETPKIVVYNVQELMYDSPEREEYNRMTFDGMRWSKTKWDGILAARMPEEKMIEYLFPILRYHSRILELNEGDFAYFAKKRQATLNGFYMRIDVLPLSQSEECDPGWMLDSRYGDAETLQQYAQAAEREEPDSEDQAADEMEIDETEADEMEIDETEADEMEIDETEVDEMEIDESEADEMEIDESEADEMEIDESAADDMEIDESAADDMEIDESKTEQGADDAGNLPDGREEKPVFGAKPMKYLDQIRAMCEEKGIRLILIKAPSVSPEWPEKENEAVVDYAKEHGLTYINFYELLDETGINYEEDTYDGGLHMNYNGARKLSKYFGSFLSESCGMPDRRQEKELSEDYAEKIRLRDEMIAGQKKELETLGEIRSY